MREGERLSGVKLRRRNLNLEKNKKNKSLFKKMLLKYKKEKGF